MFDRGFGEEVRGCSLAHESLGTVEAEEISLRIPRFDDAICNKSDAIAMAHLQRDLLRGEGGKEAKRQRPGKGYFDAIEPRRQMACIGHRDAPRRIQAYCQTSDEASVLVLEKQAVELG